MSLDDMRAGDLSVDQLRHYLACRLARECLDAESVFDELTRLALQADEATTDAFARITNTKFDRSRALKLAAEAAVSGVAEHILGEIAYGMLRDGWPESQVAFALGTLRPSQHMSHMPSTDLDEWTDARSPDLTEVAA